MANLQQQSLNEANRLLRLYLAQERKIKAKLKQALERGNDTTYLKKLQRQIGRDIAELNGIYKDYSENRMGEIYVNQALVTDSAIIASVGKTGMPVAPNKEAIKILADNTYAGLSQVTQQMGRRSAGFLRTIGLRQARGIVFGSETWQEVARNMTKELNENNFFFVKYKTKKGVRLVPSKVYSKMVARTTAAEANRQGTINRMVEWGWDLVLVTGISRFEGSPCIPYQGKSLSISGKTKGYTPLQEARANGFNHPNCIHSLSFSSENKKLIRQTK